MEANPEIEKYLGGVLKAMADDTTPTPGARIYNSAYNAVLQARRDALAEYHANKAALDIAKEENSALRARLEAGKDFILNELHRQVGYCGHCGKKSAAVNHHSILPESINTDVLISILDNIPAPDWRKRI